MNIPIKQTTKITSELLNQLKNCFVAEFDTKFHCVPVNCSGCEKQNCSNCTIHKRTTPFSFDKDNGNIEPTSRILRKEFFVGWHKLSKNAILTYLYLLFSNITNDGTIPFIRINDAADYIKCNHNTLKNSLYRLRDTGLIEFDDNNVKHGFVTEISVPHHKKTVEILSNKRNPIISERYNSSGTLLDTTSDSPIAPKNNVFELSAKWFRKLIDTTHSKSTNIFRFALNLSSKVFNNPRKGSKDFEAFISLRELKLIASTSLSYNNIQEGLRSLKDLFSRIDIQKRHATCQLERNFIGDFYKKNLKEKSDDIITNKILKIDDENTSPITLTQKNLSDFSDLYSSFGETLLVQAIEKLKTTFNFTIQEIISDIGCVRRTIYNNISAHYADKIYGDIIRSKFF